MNRRLWFSMMVVALALAACTSEPRDEVITSGDSGADAGADAGSGVGSSDTSDGVGSSADARADADSTTELDGARGPDAASDVGVTLSPRYEVDVTTHVYGQGLTHDGWMGDATGEVDLVLDLWEPIDAPAGRPAIVIIHGGGFRGGSRTNANSTSFAQFFSERGFVAVTIDYRLLGDYGTVPQRWFDFIDAAGLEGEVRDQGMALYPAARDARAAVRWLHANAGTYAIDTDHVTALGGSAGSYLAIMLGVTDPSDFRDEIDIEDDRTLVTTNLGAGSDVHTIIDHWGGITHMEILEAIDGRSRFDSADAPVSIVHGTADSTVPFEEAEKLREAYDRTGVSYAWHRLDGVGHGAWGTLVDGMSLQELAFAFVIDTQSIATTP